MARRTPEEKLEIEIQKRNDANEQIDKLQEIVHQKKIDALTQAVQIFIDTCDEAGIPVVWDNDTAHTAAIAYLSSFVPNTPQQANESDMDN
jgi:hypothetical protein